MRGTRVRVDNVKSAFLWPDYLFEKAAAHIKWLANDTLAVQINNVKGDKARVIGAIGYQVTFSQPKEHLKT